MACVYYIPDTVSIWYDRTCIRVYIHIYHTYLCFVLKEYRIQDAFFYIVYEYIIAVILFENVQNAFFNT